MNFELNLLQTPFSEVRHINHLRLSLNLKYNTVLRCTLFPLIRQQTPNGPTNICYCSHFINTVACLLYFLIRMLVHKDCNPMQYRHFSNEKPSKAFSSMTISRKEAAV